VATPDSVAHSILLLGTFVGLIALIRHESHICGLLLVLFGSRV